MLGSRDANANLAVKSLAAARPFYEDVLGLTPVASEGEDLVVYKSGNTHIIVYVSDYAGTNQATAVTWDVGDDIDDLVAALRERGVRFEHYDLPDTTREGDVHVSEGRRVAWFKDPDGNIFNLASG